MKPSARQVSAYVRACARKLSVDCKVACRLDPKMSDDTWAMHDALPSGTSLVRVGPKLMKSPRASTWRRAIAHELLHAHLRHYRGPMEAAQKTLGEGLAYWYDHVEEDVVHRLEPVLARLLDDPPWLAVLTSPASPNSKEVWDSSAAGDASTPST